jgi:tetratricopeptide (TPR) repeat protein
MVAASNSYSNLNRGPHLVSSETEKWGEKELFLRGNKYYAEKDYENAFHAYDMISKKGRAVLYNMGNCLYNQEKYPEALVYWLKAEEGATAKEYALIQQNKNLAYTKIGKQKEESWSRKMMHMMQSPLLYVSLFFLQLFFLLCWWIFMLMLHKKQTGLKKIAQSILCCMIAVFAAILGTHYTQHNKKSAVVIKKEAKLFAGPDKSFHVLSSLVCADNAAVKESREGWHKIQYADMIGWVEADVIQII